MLQEVGAPYSLVVTKNAAFNVEPNNSLTTPQDITGLTTALGYVRQGEPGQPVGPARRLLPPWITSISGTTALRKPLSA